ncbi:MAG: DUF2270 domain-containing protein [Anaerolineae bacterium]
MAPLVSPPPPVVNTFQVPAAVEAAAGRRYALVSMTDEAAPEGPGPGAETRDESDAVWTFRGYHLQPAEFNTALVHLFRAEISRANTWRMRLDATTNWAVITTGAAVSLAFRTSLGIDHAVIILNTLLITLFLFIEARRYRYYELWSYRVRLMETDFYAAMLVPPFRPAADWAETLAENLLNPRFPISMLEAFGRRFRRNYLWIYVLLGLAWIMKISTHPEPAADLTEIFTRARIGIVPGWLVVAVGVVYNTVLMAVGILTVGLKRATGEVLPRYHAAEGRDILDEVKGARGVAARFRPSRRREQVIALVVTTNPEEVSRLVLQDMSRGVTKLEGRGMFTGAPRGVLMSAITVTEVKQFQAICKAGDPGAFVMVVPASQVMGSGFVPLSEAEAEKAGRL